MDDLFLFLLLLLSSSLSPLSLLLFGTTTVIKRLVLAKIFSLIHKNNTTSVGILKPSHSETGIEASHALMYFYLRQGRQNTYKVTLWRVWILWKQSLPACLWRWNRQSVPKRRHIKFRRWGITQKKTYNIQKQSYSTGTCDKATM